jgi:hypothetical protein
MLGGLGLGSTFHRTLFQCMVSALSAPPTVAYPTVQALSLEMTVTLFTTLAVLPDTFGLETRVQALPFQCSIRVCGSAEPVWPTAHALVADVVATALKYPLPGVLTRAHVRPFQWSARVCDGENQLVPPTAQTSLAEVDATPSK